jgi:hypothetical protein
MKGTTMPNATRTPVATPKVKADILATLPGPVDQAIRDAYRNAPNGLKGADLARILIATGHLENKGNPGLVLRTYMRSHGAWVGQGRTYGMTVAEARKVAAGFIAGIAPPKGVRYAKGQAIIAKADGATPAEVASAS